MIIRMAKVEIIGPKQDLLSTLDLLHNRGIFQPDPQLMERVELVDDEQLQTLVLDENELRERSFFQGLQERVTNLLELLPEVNNGISPLQPLPVMGLLDELVDQHLATARDLVRSLNECRRNAEDLQHDLSFWEALEPLLENLPKTSNLEIFGVTIRDSRQLHNLDSLLQERTQGRCYISSTTTTDGTLIGLIATDKAMADGLRQALTAEKVPELSLPEELVGLPLPQRIMALHDKLKTQLGQCNQFEGRLMDMSRRWRPIYRRALVWLEERLALYRATATAYTTRLCFIVQGWMANHDVASLQDDLNRSFSGRVVLEQLAILEEDLDQVPVMLRNPGYFAPFEILSRLGLDEKRKTQYFQLSTGQQRRLALALAINHNPPVIILDEPTAGLDVASRSELHDMMQELRDQGTTLILATHDMAEAEKMTDRVAILLRGEIVATGSPRELTAKGSGLTKVSVRTELSRLHNNGQNFPAVTQERFDDEYAIYFSTDPGPTVSAILDFISSNGDKLIDLRVERPSLEERFLEITANGGAE